MLSFAQPGLLWGLTAIALPIAAHFIHRHTTRQLVFPSLRFIRPSRLPQQGRRRPTDITLMLLRILLISIIVLTLAGPQWQLSDPKPARVEQKEAIIVLDLSASMGGWGGIDEAKSKALSLIESSPHQKLGYVFYANDVLAEEAPTQDIGRVKQAIRDAKPTLAAGNPVAALKAAQAMSMGTGQTDFFLYSDFQAPEWQKVGGELEALGQTVRLIPVGEDRDGNIAIQYARTAPHGSENLRVWVHLRSYASKPARPRVALRIGDKTWHEEVALAPFSSNQFHFIVPKSPFHEGIVSLEETDSLAADNTWHLWVQPPPPAKIKMLLPPFKNAELEAEALYLGTALASEVPYDWQRFEVDSGLGLGLVGQTFGEFEAIIVPALDTNLGVPILEDIREYVASGGTLLATPGATVAETLHLLRDSGIFRAELKGLPGKVAGAARPYRIGSISEASLLARTFRGEARKDLLLASIYRYAKIEPKEDCEALITSEEGDPLLIHKKLGRGSVYLFAFRLNTLWSDLPLRNAFLPLVREIVGSNRDDDEPWRLAFCGETLIDSDGKSVDTSRPLAMAIGDQPVTVNVHRDESVPDTIHPSKLTGSTKQRRSVAPSTPASANTSANDGSLSLRLWFALTALGLYFLESIAAWYLATRQIRTEETGNSTRPAEV